MSQLLKQIQPGKNDDSLKKFLKDVEFGGISTRKTRSTGSGFAGTESAVLPPSLEPGIETPSLTHSPEEEQQNSPSETEAPVTPADNEQPQTETQRLVERAMSQRNRLGRNNARGGSQDISAQSIWNEFDREHLSKIMELEARAAALGKNIIELEAKMKVDKDSGTGLAVADLETLSDLYRQQVKVNDDIMAKVKNEGITTTLTMMIEMKKQEEQAAAEKARASSSRTGLDFDGPSDSPVPSPADNRQIKKLGASRTGSQPPNRPGGTPSESNERASKPKIVYAQNEDVAFKRRTAAKPEEQDWILGKVSRVIGEGKSRRYEVEDPYPDDHEKPVLYKSSASQMVPIPPKGTPLEDYEVGRRVLALYPETTTFYRAEVKAMLDPEPGEGDEHSKERLVQLLFEDEAAGELKIVTRRYVLDHKG